MNSSKSNFFEREATRSVGVWTGTAPIACSNDFHFFVLNIWMSLKGHFGDDCLQSITCTVTGNLNRTTKRQNTYIQTQINATQTVALTNSIKHSQNQKTSANKEDTQTGLVAFTTSGHETKRVYSFNPKPTRRPSVGARAGNQQRYVGCSVVLRHSDYRPCWWQSVQRTITTLLPLCQ